MVCQNNEKDVQEETPLFSLIPAADAAIIQMKQSYCYFESSEKDEYHTYDFVMSLK